LISDHISKALTIPYLEPSGSYNVTDHQTIVKWTIPYLEPSGSYNQTGEDGILILTIPYLEPSGSYNYRCVDVNTTPKLSQILEIK